MAGKGANGLNDRQEAFCREYLTDMNATQAAIRAGYSRPTCHAIAHKLLKKAEIRNRIEEMGKEIMAAKAMTPAKVLEEFRKLATFDIRKLYHGDGSPKAIHELDDDTAAAVVGLDAVMVGNADLGVGQVLKYKLANKLGALESLAKIFGMHAPERLEHTGANGGPIEVANSDELARRVAFTFLQVEAKSPASGGELP